MENNTVNIGSRAILWIVLSAVMVVLGIVLLNTLDQRRKFHQYRDLYQSVLTSNYPERFSGLLDSFNSSDTVKLKSIKENLGMLQRDFDEIYYSEIIIKSDSLFYIITNTQNYSRSRLVSGEMYLEKNKEKYVEYLDSTDQVDLHTLLELSDDPLNMDIVLKITDNSYLFLKYYRK